MSFILPRRADFWRPWIFVAVVAAVMIGVYATSQNAHALTFKRHGYGVRIQHGVFRHRAARSISRALRFRSAARSRRYALARFVIPAAGRSGDVVSIAMRYLRQGNPTGTRRAWCGDFVNMTERLAGRPGLAGGGLVSAWRSYGHASGPVRGAIAVMPGHVSRVVQRLGDHVLLISGNWSHRVMIHAAPIRSIIAFRSF